MSDAEIKHFQLIHHEPSKYFFSLLIIIFTSIVQFLIYPWIGPAPYLLFYPAIMVATIYGDGSFAVILSTLASHFFIDFPRIDFVLNWPNDFFRSLIFFTSSLALSQITHRQILSGIRNAALAQNLENEKKLREQFVITLTHDLRNPISAANVAVQLYLKHPERADVMRIMRRILSATERADRMIRDLLDANAIKAGQKLDLPFAPTDLLLIAEDVVEEKSLKLGDGEKILLRAKKPVRGNWNGDGLRRILENLIDNALKYGDTTKPISIDVFQDQNSAHIVVHNFGKPLTAEETQKIFEAFGRAHFAKNSGKQGWGLGLTLVRGVAEAHRGVATVSSGPEGTSFTVKIPLDPKKEKVLER
jgi:signal transduction histidine kinase